MGKGYRIAIIADDLTGACDAAAPFAARGAACEVSVWGAGASHAELAAISTESRDLEETEIIRRMQLAAKAVGARDLVFKKIDSTLRGNVRAEVAAALSAFGFSNAVVTPAFPAMERRVRDGYLYVGCAGPLPCPLPVLDAWEDGDLDRIVAGHLAHPVLWAGSAGLATALARRLYGDAKPLPAPRIEGPLIFCIGSDHPATIAQVRALSSHLLFPIVRNRTTCDEIRRKLAGAGALFITGGDTVSLILAAIGAHGIAVRQDVLTGVPWGVLMGGVLDGHPVVTKSGGFGAPDALLRVAQFFTT